MTNVFNPVNYVFFYQGSRHNYVNIALIVQLSMTFQDPHSKKGRYVCYETNFPQKKARRRTHVIPSLQLNILLILSRCNSSSLVGIFEV